MKSISFIGCFLAMFLLNTTLSAQQGLMFGFKAGMNFNTFIGQSELDDSGEALEKGKFASGFTVGGKIMYSFTDDFGVGAELLYAQKNAKYRYEGSAYQVFELANVNPIYSEGPSKYLMTVQNSYADIPFYVYYDIGTRTRFRISAGANLGFLVVSRGDGELTFEGANPEVIDKITVDLNYNFFKDGLGELSNLSSEDQDIVTESLGVLEGVAPSNIGAYYYNTEKDKSFFNLFDFGGLVDFSVIVGNGLNIGLRANYSFNDITNNFYDFSKQSAVFNSVTNSYDPIQRSDKDGYFGIQAHIGFNF